MLLELITGRLPIIATESLMNEGLVGWVSSLISATVSLFQVLNMVISI